MDEFKVALGGYILDKAKIQTELDKTKDLHVKISDIVFDGKALEKIQSALNNSKVSLNIQSNLNNSDLQRQGQQLGQTVGQQITSGINNTIQRGSFEKIFNPSSINTAAKEAEKYFQTISKSVSVTENLGANNNLTSFIVSLKNADGVVEKLRYNLQTLKDDDGNITSKFFQYSGGNINDNGVIQQFTKISAKADDLTLKLDKVKSAYSDINSPKAIKNEQNVSQLASQYDKVVQSIASLRNADDSTFSAMTANVNKEISSLENMVKQFKNAEYAATSLRTKDISTIKVDEGNSLNTFVEKMKQSGNYTVELQGKVSDLKGELSKVFDSNSLTNYLNKLSNVKSEFDSVNAAANTVGKATKLQTNVEMELNKLRNYRQELESNGTMTDVLRQKFDGLETSLNKVGTSTGLTTWRAEMKSVQSDVDATKNKFNELANVEKLALQKTNVKSNIDEFLATNTKLTGDLRNRFLELRTAIDSVDDNKALANVKTQLSTLKNEAKSAGMIGKSLGDTFKENISAFTNWFGIGTLVAGSVRVLRDMYRAVYDIDTAMTNLYKVTDETNQKYNQFLNGATTKAQELGRSVSSLVEQTATWAKLGFGIDEAAKLAQISSIYSNVGEVDDKTAVSDLVTAIKAFNIESSKSITIVDSLNKLGNEFATDAGSLGEGLKNAASALALGGMDINKSLALLTGGSEITQNAGELGNALKIGQMRVMGMKGALEQLGEESEGLESVSKIQTHILNITKGQVNIMKEADPTKFRDYYDILESVSNVYDKLDQTKQADLLETLFGKQRGNQGAAILQAFQSGQVQKALEASKNAAGSAYEEQARWLDSLEAKTQQYGASFQSLSQTILNSNFFKGLIDSGTGFNNILESIIHTIGLLPASAGVVGLGAFIKNFDNLKNVSLASTALKDFNSVAQAGSISYSALADTLKSVDNQTKINIVSQSALTTEQKLTTLQTAGLSTAELNTVISTNALSASQVGATATAGGLSLALKGLWATMLANPILAVGMVLTAGISIWSRYKQSVEETRQATQDAANVFNDSSSSIQEYTDKYKALHDELTKSNTTEERQHEIKTQLLSLQKELNEKYGDEYGRLNLVTDAYKDQTDAIKELNTESAKKYLLENREGIESATRKMEQDRTYSLGSTGYMSNDYAKQLYDIASKYQDQGINLEQFNAGSETGYTIKFTGDAEQADKVIHELASQVQDLQKKFGDNNFVQSFLNNSANALKENNKVLDKYQEIYDSSLMAQIASDNKLSEGYNSATTAVKNYNDAVASGDESKIATARKDLDDVKNSIDLTSDDWKRYGAVITDVFSQADTKLYDFSDALKSNQNGIMDLTNSLSGMSKEDLLSMADDGSVDNFDKLVEAGKSYGLTVEDVISVLEKLKIVQGEVTQSGENVFTPLSKQDVIANINSLSEGFESLDKIMNSMQSKDPFDYSLLDDDKFKKTFGELGESYSDFIEKISSSPKDIKGTQSAFNDLVTEWIDSSGVLNGLTEDNASLATTMLKNMGVANAEEVVTNRLTVAQEHLAAQKAYTADMSNTLTNATADEIPNIIEEATQSDIAKVALAGLAIEKANVNNTALDTSGDIENIIALTGVIGTANSALKALNILKSGGNVGYGLGGKEGYDAVVAAAQKEVDDAIKAAEDYKGKGTSANVTYTGGTKTNKASGSGASKSSQKDTSETFDWIAVDVKNRIDDLDKLKDKLDEIDSWKSKNKATDELLGNMSWQLGELEKAANTYQTNANEYAEKLNKTYISKIEDGSLEVEKITDDVVVNNVKGYQEWYEKSKDVKEKIDDVKKSMTELAKSKIDNIINAFDSLISLMNKTASSSKEVLNIQKELGEEITSDDYKNLINQQEDIYNQLENKYESLSKELSKAVSKGTIKAGTEEWRKYQEELISVKDSKNDAVSEMNNLRQTMIDLPFDEVSKYADELDRANDSISTMSDLIGDEGLIDNGAITSKGLAKIALYGQQYANAKQKAAEYANAIDALNEMYDEGSLTQDEYNQRLKDLEQNQLSAVKATKEAETAILQFRKNAIQAQIDDMNDLVSAKKEALQAEKDYQDYLDSVNKKQTNINNLQAKINELSLRSDSSDRTAYAMKLQLEKQLKDAKDELAKEQADNAYNQQLDALDKEAENYSNAKNDELDELENNYDKQQKVISDYLSDVKNNYNTVYKTLTEYGENYNLATTDDLTSPWESASSAVDTFQSAVGDAIAQINIDIASIDLSGLTELVSTMQGFSGGSSGGGFEDVTGSGTWQKTSKGYWYGSSNDDYVSDGVYTIGGKQYNFNEDGYMKTGWDDSTGDWRYFEPENGQMVKSTWRNGKDGKQYYLKSDGTMATDMAIKAKNGSGYYYVNDDGTWDGKTLSYDEVKRSNITVGYASGTLSAKSGLAYVDEPGVGSELMRDNTGTLMQFKGGETVFNSGMTKTLYDIASDSNGYIMKTLMSNLPTLDTTKITPNNNGIALSITSPLITIDRLDSSMESYIDAKINALPGMIVDQMNSAYKTKGTQR